MRDIEKTVEERHSVRTYLAKPIEEEKANALRELAKRCEEQGGIGISLVLDDPAAFEKFILPYGKIKAYNYFALYAKPDMDEQIGYFGEMLVIKAQQLGLNTCWAGGSFNKKYVLAPVKPEEKLYALIAVGYGENAGHPRRSKSYSRVSVTGDGAPDWYRRGVDFALKAPTAVNLQSFKFELINGEENAVRAIRTFGIAYGKIDMGIVKYHFELGADRKINWK